MGNPWSQFKVSFQWPKISEVDAAKIADAHNRDIAALDAERDELQRRLAAVVVKISEAVVSDDDCVCSMLCHSAITAIAEGRTE